MPLARHLQPERLDLDPTEPDADKKFKHWMKTFTNYIAGLDANDNKLGTLMNFVGHQAYALIEEDTTYDNAVTTLKSHYQKTVEPHLRSTYPSNS